MKNFEFLKRIKLSSVLIAAGLLILTVLISVLATSYFSESVFYLNQEKYKKASEQGAIISYRSGSAPPIEVRIEDGNRKVTIDKLVYSINRMKDINYNNKFELTYPNGTKYDVNDQSGFLMSYDENGEWVTEMSVYMNNQRVIQEGEELYSPGSLVMAAYSEYHSKQGSPVAFVFSFILLLYGWCGFRYQKFQNFLFLISLRWIWVQDPEPSDFYYFMCKVGGVLAMIGSFFLLVKSF